MASFTEPSAAAGLVLATECMERNTGSDSPTSPTFSPITPVMSNDLSTQHAPHNERPQLPELPPLQPFAESENPDAIALRAAISVLQIQRQQALRDLVSLEQQKKLAAANPQAFVRAVASGAVKTRSTGPSEFQTSFASLHSDSNEDEGEEQLGSDTVTPEQAAHSAFEDIPGPQNIVRCPPVNWAKYHVLGQPLDDLHEEQRRRPADGHTSEDKVQLRGEEHVIAAPYNPWKDRLEPRTKKKDPRPEGSHNNG
ncbi:MAG: hypothetical protein Q9186_007360 [Xanthomendoza sp. 1 TL-2023]